MPFARRIRALLVLVTAVAVGLVLATIRHGLGAAGSMPAEETSLVVAGQWALWLVVSYVVAIVAVASGLVLCGRPDGTRTLLRAVPRASRPAAMALLGVVVTAGPAAAASPPPLPALTAPITAAHDVTAVDPFDWTAPADAPDRIATALSDRAVRPGPPSAASVSRRAPPRPDRIRTVRVGVGDCLWSLAARDLAAGHVDFRPVDVVLAWHRWYAVNRATIGPDPGLLRPGEVLRVPPPNPPLNPSTRHTERHP